jgi:hypothetical protein
MTRFLAWCAETWLRLTYRANEIPHGRHARRDARHDARRRSGPATPA